MNAIDHGNAERLLWGQQIALFDGGNDIFTHEKGVGDEADGLRHDEHQQDQTEALVDLLDVFASQSVITLPFFHVPIDGYCFVQQRVLGRACYVTDQTPEHHRRHPTEVGK